MIGKNMENRKTGTHRIYYNWSFWAKKPGKKNNRKGITLIELAVVISIIGILITVIAMNIDVGGIKNSTAALQLATDRNKIPSYLEIYSSKYGEYPTEEQGLSALVERPESGDAPESYTPVIKNKAGIRDPWGNPYILKYNESGQYMIITLGKDKQDGGEGVNADFNILEEDEYPEIFRKK